MCGMGIELKDSIMHLGVELSSVLGFRKHIIKASNKAEKTGSALAWLIPNVGGPSPSKKKHLATVVH